MKAIEDRLIMTKRSSQSEYRLGVGVMLINTQGQVLVGKRIDTESDGWQMPQGGIDANESPEQAALRELEEEIGVVCVELLAATKNWLSYDFPPDLQVKLWDGNFRGQKQKWFLCRFLGENHEININTKNPEFSEWQWVDIEKIISLAIDFKIHLYSQIVEEFKPLISNSQRQFTSRLNKNFCS